MFGYRRLSVAKEGGFHLALLAALTALGWQFAGLYGLLLPGCAFLFVLYLFREPHCAVPSEPLAVLSPVEGVVTQVERVEDRRLKRAAKCIRLETGLLDAGIVRSPTEGKVQDQWFDDPDEPGAPPRYDCWLQTDEEDDVVLSVCIVRRKPLWAYTYLRTGERIGQGQRCGFFCFGAGVDVLLPARATAVVRPGDRVAAGRDILAKLVREE